MLGRVTAIEENGATSGPGLLAAYTYDDYGNRTIVRRAGGAGASTYANYSRADYPYDLTQNFAGAASDVEWSAAFTYSPTPQVWSRTSSNDAYSFAAGAASAAYQPNGLNQYATVAGRTYAYDPRGNLSSNGRASYTYDPENRLLSASGPTPVTLTYDPLGRLATTAANGATTSFLFDGDALVEESDGSGNTLRRYVPGPGQDEPLVWFEGATLASPTWLHADMEGSIVGLSDASGNSNGIYAYDPFGAPSAWSGAERYRYTGQLMIPEANPYS